MDLAEFLLARTAEDDSMNRPGPVPESWCDRAEGLHLSHARVLAECEVKWRLVGAATYAGRDRSQDETFDFVLRTLALPYADHPDYQQKWKI